jgi:molybdopterin synthase sulfur carrier subunit
VATVRIPPVLRAESGGNREVQAVGATVRELLEDLRTNLPQLGAKIYDGEQIAPFVNVYLDGEDVRTLDGVDTPVKDGSTLILLPAMAGGNG